MKEYIKIAKDFVVKNSTYVIIVLVCLGFIGLACILWSDKKADTSNVEIPQTVVLPENKEEVQKPYFNNIVQKPTDIKLSYAQALEKYKDNRIQLGENLCLATPYKMVLKNGSSLMIDNRSKQNRNITFMDQKVYIPAYDYAVLNVYSNNLPYSVLLDCDKQQNIAEIYIER